jgi:hypothetical protein
MALPFLLVPSAMTAYLFCKFLIQKPLCNRFVKSRAQ